MNLIRFISDLHLSEHAPHLTKLFLDYLERIKENTDTLYILGDLFEVWLGDDVIGDFERKIAKAIANLSQYDIKVYFLAGNRDFLLGQTYANLCQMQLLTDPFVIEIAGEKTLLTHGDDLCTLDKSHQRFRRFSRHPFIKKCFVSLPKSLRKGIANKIRNQSAKQNKGQVLTDVVTSECLKKMQVYDCTTLIHGHTHRPQIQYHHCKDDVKRQIVLSDWVQFASELCYNKTDKYQFKMRA